MALLYYSTEYKPARSQAEIQLLLLRLGARRISMEYRDNSVVGMSFTLATPAGEREFLLPARTDRVLATLTEQGVARKADPLGHAAAVAWRTLLEWVKVQAAMAETRQVAADEIMLPYLLLPGEKRGETFTLYEQFTTHKALPWLRATRTAAARGTNWRSNGWCRWPWSPIEPICLAALRALGVDEP